MKYPVITPEERRQRLEPPRKKIHAVIDSDTYNEVDDQFAISYAMLSPEKYRWKPSTPHLFHQISLHA